MLPIGITNPRKFFKKPIERVHAPEGVQYLRKDYSEEMGRERRNSIDGGSLKDNPFRGLFVPEQRHDVIGQRKVKTQPSSPGGRLANFLNNLFSTSNSKKNRKKKITATPIQEESPRRRRFWRMSISHVRSPPQSTRNTELKKSHECRHNPGCLRSNSSRNDVFMDSRSRRENGQEFSFYNSEHPLRHEHKDFGLGFVGKSKTLSAEERYSRFDLVHDGEGSDSSSDLFELQNIDLKYSSSGLPVYATTKMDGIRRGSTP